MQQTIREGEIRATTCQRPGIGFFARISSNCRRARTSARTCTMIAGFCGSWLTPSDRRQVSLDSVKDLQLYCFFFLVYPLAETVVTVPLSCFADGICTDFPKFQHLRPGTYTQVEEPDFTDLLPLYKTHRIE